MLSVRRATIAIAVQIKREEGTAKNNNYFDVEILEGLVYLTVGSMVILIDTGSPVTLHTGEELEFLGRKFPAYTRLGGFDINGLNGQLPKRITTLMGIDILSRYMVELDYRGRKVRFSENADGIDGQSIAFSGVPGLPVVECLGGGRAVKCYVDTGALYTYLPAELARQGRFKGLKRDFSPLLGGHFETPVHEHELSIGGMTFPARCGILPPLLQASLTLSDAEGVVGYDLMKDHRVTFDLGNGKMSVRKND